MKKRLLAFICLILMVSGCASIRLQKQTFTIELGQDVYANPSLYIKNPDNYDLSKMKVVALSVGIVKKDNRFITKNMDYIVVGEYDFKIVSGNNDIPFKIKIKDTKPPVVLSSISELTIAPGEQIPWSEYFPATDLSGVSYEITGLDYNNRGEYDCILNISDRFGNTTQKPVKIIVG